MDARCDRVGLVCHEGVGTSRELACSGAEAAMGTCEA